MGRRPKQGLDYFPRDVDYYDDFKIMDLINEYGPLGQTIYDVVISTVYKEGYYLEVPIDKLAMKIVRIVGNRWIKDKSLVLQVIQYCADIGLFNKDLLTQDVITSAGIQRRYSEVTVRNKVNKEKYWLIDKSGQLLINAPENSISVTEIAIDATETPIYDSNNATKESKGNKSKLKESIDYQLIADLYNDTCVSFPKLTKLSDSRKKAIKARLNTYNIDDFKRLFEMAEQSNFLKGGNNRNWFATFDWLISDANMAKVLDGNYGNRPIKSPQNQAPTSNKFHNFEQRSYDYEELEKKFLEKTYGKTNK